MNGRRWSLALTGAALMTGALPTAAWAAFPGGNGRIAYQYEAPVPGEGLTQSDLFTVKPGGTGRMRLTDTPHRNEMVPVWNATGTEIAFQRSPAPFGPGSIWVVDADGTDPRRLTRFVDARNPTWSPDGTRIAYDNVQNIYSIRASDGGDRRRVTFTANAMEFEAAWSPDGERMVFTRGFEKGDVGDLYVLNLVTREIVQITDSPDYDHQASWSPDGERIVFERDFDDRFAIFVVDADGSNLRRLTFGPFFDIGPAFSPNGKRIVFASDRGGEFFHELWTMNTAGMDRRRITHDEFVSAFPDWQPLPAG